MYGSTNPLVLARFWSKVDVRRPGECWEWQNALNSNGYGIFRPSAGMGTVRAHRFAYIAVKGDLAPSDKVRHSCDNPMCCNPHHLLAGTQAQNVADMHERGRRKYSSRLTDADVLEVIRLARSGENYRNIAMRFGVSRAWVSDLATGKARVAQRIMDGE